MGQSRVSRNDPCPCGSGKKYKQCCMSKEHMGRSPRSTAPITDLQGKPWSLADHKGRNVVLLFFLGGKCAHCMQQLQVFGK